MNTHASPSRVAVARLHWRAGGTDRTLSIQEGRTFIGNTSACHVQCPEDVRAGIVAMISSADDDIVLKRVGETLNVRVHGRALSMGECAHVGDRLDFIVGRTHFTLARALNDATNRPVTLEPRQSASGGTPTRAPSEEVDASDALAVRRLVTRQLLQALNISGLELASIRTEETKRQIAAKLKGIVAQLGATDACGLTSAQIEKQVIDEVVGLGPLEDLLVNPAITEIMVNSANQIFIEERGRLELSPVVFSSEQALLAVIERIVSQVNRRVDASLPIVDARLPDGSRVNAIIPPIALKGPSLTIRRFSRTPITVGELVARKSMSGFAADMLRLCVESHLNMVISGGTGSGKTTLLNALSGFIPAHERIVTIEDAAELQLQQPHVVSLETRTANLEGRGAITIRDLVKNCLRMRPDRIVVGECRGGEALDMLQAMNTGHDGSLTTAHANTPEDMLRRLETMVLMAGVDFPLRAIREQIASGVHVIIQQTRLHTGRRLVTAITWIDSLERETGTYATVPLIRFKQAEGSDQGVLLTERENIMRFAEHFHVADAMRRILSKHGEAMAP